MENVTNLLYYGDNLDILRRHVKDETVDLVYLDPPFNSNATYNVLFAEKNGSKAASQIQAFTDTWTWTQESESIFAEIVTSGGRVADCLQAFRKFLGECDMLAYLVMMAPRLVELRRVMKQTASIYLHCDPTASHYLKMLMDAVFGSINFRNEIIWKRTFAHGNVSRNYGSITDSILFFSKTNEYKWNQPIKALSEEEINRKYPFEDPDGRRWQSVTLRNPGRRPNLHYPYTASNGITYLPHPNGWSCNQERMQKYDQEGRLHFPNKQDGALRLKMYADESPGERLQNIWDDIPPISANAQERLGYPTQKPQALLERIISASSSPDDIIFDPFCGCGTTIAAAQSLGRPWIGIDITQLAITLIKRRLKDSFGEDVGFMVIGEPVSLPDAQRLAESDPYQFQCWALGLVGARPAEIKKGADKGIDGRIIFEGDKAGVFENVILSVKAGKTGSAHVRDLKGVLDREKAAIGVFISMQEPTSHMVTEAVTAGFYESAFWGKKYPKIQLLTVAELLAGKKIEMPPIRQVGATFKKAPRVVQEREDKQGKLQL